MNERWIKDLYVNNNFSTINEHNLVHYGNIRSIIAMKDWERFLLDLIKHFVRWDIFEVVSISVDFFTKILFPSIWNTFHEIVIFKLAMKISFNRCRHLKILINSISRTTFTKYTWHSQLQSLYINILITTQAYIWIIW